MRSETPTSSRSGKIGTPSTRQTARSPSSPYSRTPSRKNGDTRRKNAETPIRGKAKSLDMAAASDKKTQLKEKKNEAENNELWELISITSSGNSI